MSFFIQRKKDALESPDIFVHKNVVDSEPKRRRRSKEPVASSSYLSPSAEKRPQAAEPVQESEPPAMGEFRLQRKSRKVPVRIKHAPAASFSETRRGN